VTVPLEQQLDPFSPRPIDLPTPVPLEPDAELDRIDAAKILAAPDDPAHWPAWREALTRWRTEAAQRIEYDDSAYRALEFAWTRGCFSVALVWLWDELLYDHVAGHFTPKRFCAESEREFGGFDGIVLWHAYPVIGIDERNQFDFYRDVPGMRELVEELRAHGLRVFVNYNPWDTGTRREPVADEIAIAELVRELGVDGVFLDTMKEAQLGLRAALDAVRPGVALEGESTLPLAHIRDHHLSWAQWFSDSSVPGVLRARWFEQRHMLHHTRRWNRDHAAELHSAWLNGVGVLVWENVFGAWVGWNERDKELLRAMLSVQRQHADLLATGEWTPLAAASPDTRVVASRWTDGETTLWALANRGDAYAGAVGELEVEIPALGIAAFVGSEQVMVAGGRDASFPAREAVRVPAPVVRVEAVPEGFVAVEPRPLTARFRRRETGTYGEAPYIEEWKPLPPRLHDFVEVERPAPPGRFAISVRGIQTGLDLAGARAYAASVGARLPTEDEWQLAAEAGVLDLSGPRVWNWTESEHSDGRTRFAILKGGSDWEAAGSDWYVDGGPQEPSYSLKLLLLGGGMARSPRIGFRLAVDLP
jgi:sulfatase modifying factor 1